MANYSSIASGNWNDGPTTWGTGAGVFPVAGDNVTVNNTHTVTLTADAACATLTINTGGVVNTSGSNYTITVSGLTTVNGALTCNASTCSFGSGITGSTGLMTVNNGTFNGSSGTTTMGSMRLLGTSNVNLNNGTYNINSYYTILTIDYNIGIVATVTLSNPGTINFTLVRNTNYPVSATITLGNVTFSGNFTMTYRSGAVGSFASLTINAGCTLDTSAIYNGALTVTGDTIIHGNLYTNASAISLNVLDVRAGGLYRATTGITYIDSTSYNRGTIQLPNGATIQGITGNENFALYSDIDWDFGGALSNVHLVGIVIVANTDLTTGGSGIVLDLNSVNFSSAITDRILTISAGDTLQALTDSSTNLHVALAVRGNLLIDTGVEFNCSNIDVYGAGQIRTPGTARIDQRLGFTNYTTTFRSGMRMGAPVRLENTVVRGDFHADDIYNLGGCDVGVGYSY